MTSGISGAESPIILHTRRYANAPSSENARSNFIVRLQVAANLEEIRAIARQFALTPEIALPAWMRAAALAGDSIQHLLEAATALYSYGLDEAAGKLVEKALVVDPISIAALQLKAALTADAVERRRIFEQILKIEPGNRVAVDNLILLDRPR